MILQEKYGLKIGGMFLVVLHPNQNTYARIPCADLAAELALLKEVRRQEVLRQGALQQEKALSDNGASVNSDNGASGIEEMPPLII